VTESTRPPGLDTVAEEGLKLGARLAVGLLAVPLMGLSLLARGSARAEPPPPQPAAADPVSDTPPASDPADAAPIPEASPDTAPEGAAPNGAAPAGGPAQAEVALALRKLADATLAKPAHAARKKKRADETSGPSPAPAARAKGRRAGAAETPPRTDDRRFP
jgi:hypothetical protein